MSKNKDDAKGGKPKATNADDVLVGSAKNDSISGKKGNDQISGLAGHDKLKGDQGNDVLDGGDGNDKLYGGKGDDRILGGAGNDVLYGDAGKGKGWGWDKFCWWKPKSDDDDYLDGGAGSDKVYGGKGDDVAVYSMAGNLGAGFRNIGTKDDYDGGSGHDTLVLQLTHGEAALASVKQDIAAFRKFLDSRANSRGEEFEFKSFNLDVRDFEALQVELVNTGPAARDDSGATDADTLLVLAAPGLLANDSDADHLDVLRVTGVGASALGAIVTVGANGALTYDPTASATLQALAVGTTRVDSITYTITDLGGATATATVRVTVAGTNDAPVAGADSNGDDAIVEAGVNPGNDEFAGDPDAAGNVLANDTDADAGAVLSVADAGVRAGTYGTLTLEADGDWTYALDNADADTQALAHGEAAVEQFTYTVSDEHGATGNGQLSLAVTGTNDAPLAADDAATAGEDSPLVVAAAQGLLANDSDVDHGALLSVVAASASSDLGAGVSVNADGSFTYDASGAAGLQSLAAGESAIDHFSYVVSDEHDARAFALAEVVVTGVNDGPLANEDLTGTFEDLGVSIDVLANDTDVDASDTHTVDTVTLASGLGSVSIVDNRVVYDAAGAYQNLGQGQTAEVVIEYSMSDNHGASSSSAATVIVRGANDDPDAQNDEAVADEDTVLALAPALLLANDFDADLGDVLSVVAVSETSALGADVFIHPDGSVRYDARAVLQHLGAGESETDTFTYTIEDSFGGTDTATVTLTVTGVNDAPEAENDAYQLDEGGSLTIAGAGVLANDTDVDGDTLSAVLGTGPAHGVLTLNADGSFSYTAEAGFDGTDSFTYRAADGGLQSELATVLLSVGAVNRAPVANGNSYSMQEDTTLTVAAPGVLGNDTDADGDALNAVLLSGPANGSLTFNADGSFSYTPNANFFGSDSFSYLSSDGLADSKAATVSIKIADVAESTGGKGRVADAVEPGANLQYYMRIEGVTKDWVALDSFSLGLEQTIGAIGSTRGSTAGKLQAQDVVVSLGSSQSVAKLAEYAGTSKHITKVEISAMGSGEEGLRLVDAFKFEDVVVTSLQDSSGGNQIAFDYVKFGHSHVLYDEVGKKTGDVDTGFDFKAGKAGGDGGAGMPGKGAKQDDVAGELEYYVRFEGVGGAEQWLQLDSFSMGLTNASDLSAGGGSGTGKAAASGATLVLGSSKNLVELTTRLLNATHIKTAEVEAYRNTGEGRQLVDEFLFDDVVIGSLTTGDATHNTLSFDFTKYSHGHELFGNDGKPSGFVAEGFDFKTAKAFDGPDPSADFDKGGKLADEASPAADLRYYMRIEGVTKDWVELDSFSLGLEREAGVTVGGGASTAGKLEAQDVVATLGSSQSVAKLVEYAGTAKHITKVEISAMRQGGDGLRLIDAFKFEDVVVSSLQDGSGGNQIAFDYVKFGHSHVLYNEVGKKTGDVDTGYDFKLGKAVGDGGAGMPEKSAKQEDVAGELEYYVRFEGIGGAEQWLQLDAFSMSLTNAIGLGAGSGTGKTASDATLVLGSSKNLVELTTRLSGGSHIKTAEVEAYRNTGEGRQLVDEFRFDDVLLSSLTTANATHNVLTFDFAKYSHGHELYGNDGKPSGFVAEGFDFKTAKAFDGPDPSADFDKGGKLADEVSPDADLRYYMRIEGVTKDWVELDSFSLGLQQTFGAIGGGGALFGILEAQDVAVSLGSSQSVAKLVEYAAAGKHITKVEISAMGSGDEGLRLVDAFKFEDVLVTSLQDGSGGNQIAFDYVKFGHSHVLYDEVGKKTGDVDTGFDFKAGKAGGDGGAGMPGKGAKQDDVAGELEYYVRFEGVGGTEQWLQLDAFSMGLTNTGSLSAGGGSGAGKAAASDVTLVLGSSKNLVELTTKLSSGAHIKTAEVEAYRNTGEGRQLVDEFRFDDVLVSSLTTSNATHNVLTFDFAKYSHGHELYDDLGKSTGFVAEGFDFSTVKAFDGPNPTADIGFF